MFVLTYCLKDVFRSHSFKDTVKEFMSHVKADIEADNMSLQMLETACWITTEGEFPVHFYDCRDFALDCGWMNEKGEWLED
jgi:hypothetical protein